MKTVVEILDFCRKENGSFCVIIPFMDNDGTIKQLQVKNPFFTESACLEKMLEAEKELFEAPQKLKEIGDNILKRVSRSWEFK